MCLFAYDIKLCGSLRLNLADSFPLRLMGEFPEAVDAGKTTQESSDVCSRYY